MTHYAKEIDRIKRICYRNKAQIEKVIGTRHYINNHLDKKLNLSLLSRIRFSSKFHFLRLFKRYYGQTPRQYLIEKRLEQAKKMLLEGSSISGTCYDIGFESPSSFSTLFKARFGLSPGEYQKKSNFHKVEKF